MKLDITNDPQTEHHIIVEEDEKIQQEWYKAFAHFPHAEPFITNSISEALCAWSRLYMNDCLPRSVIVDWNVGLKDVSGKEGGIWREGTHYFLHYCIDLSPEGTFVVYTDNEGEVMKDLQKDIIVAPHITIVRKEKYNVAETLALVQESPAFIREASGYFQLP